MALVSFLNAGWFSGWFDSTPTPPISIPIDLSKAGSVVETEVRVEEKGAYYFSLVFLYTDEMKDGIRDANIARKIIGCNGYQASNGMQLRFCDYESAKQDLGSLIDETYNSDGTIIPIKLTLFQMLDDGTKKRISDKSYQTRGDNGGWRYHMMRDFEMIILEKGKYSIRVENIKSISEMKNREANFRFARHGHK